MIQSTTVTDKITRHSLRVITGQAGFFPDLSGAQREENVTDRGGRRADTESYCGRFNQYSSENCVHKIMCSIPVLMDSDEAQQQIYNIYIVIQNLTDSKKFNNPHTNYSNICLLNNYLNELNQPDNDKLPLAVKEALLPVIYKIFDEYGKECRHDFFGCFNRKKDENLLSEINRVFSPLESLVFNNLLTTYKSTACAIENKTTVALTGYDKASELKTIEDIRNCFNNYITKVKEQGMERLTILRRTLTNCIESNNILLGKMERLYNQSLNNFKFFSRSLTEDDAQLLNILSCLNNIIGAAKAGEYITVKDIKVKMENDLPALFKTDSILFIGGDKEYNIQNGYLYQKCICNFVQHMFFQVVQECSLLNYLYKNLSCDNNITSIVSQQHFTTMLRRINDDLFTNTNILYLNKALSNLLNSIREFIGSCSKIVNGAQGMDNLTILKTSVWDECEDSGPLSPGLTNLISQLLTNRQADSENSAMSSLKEWRDEMYSSGHEAFVEYSELSDISKYCTLFNNSYEELKSEVDSNLSNCSTAKRLLGENFDAFLKSYNQLAAVCTSVMEVFEAPFVKEAFPELNLWGEYNDQKFLLRNPLNETATVENCINGYSVLSHFYTQIISYCKIIGDKLLLILDKSLEGLLLSIIPENATNVTNENEIPVNVSNSPQFKILQEVCASGHAQAVRDLSSATGLNEMDPVRAYNMALDVRKNAVRTLCSVLLGHRSWSNLEHISKDLVFNHSISNKPLAQLMYAILNIIQHHESINSTVIDESYRVAYWKFTRGIINIISEIYYVNPSQLNMDYSEGGNTGFRALLHKLHLTGQPGSAGRTETFFLMLALSGNISYIDINIREKTPEHLDLAIERQKKITMNKIIERNHGPLLPK